jgi:hypothetical protein
MEHFKNVLSCLDIWKSETLKERDYTGQDVDWRIILISDSGVSGGALASSE